MKTEKEAKVELFLKMSTSRTKNGLIMTTSMSNQSLKFEIIDDGRCISGLMSLL